MGRAPTNTKQKLIETASDLIWQSSYGAVSVDDICRAADVKKGSFYHYFKSKADLAVATMEAYYEQSKVLFDEVFSAAIPPLERFERLCDAMLVKQQEAFEKYGRVCGCPFASMGSEMAGQEDMIRAKVDEIFGRYARYYESTLRDMIAEGLLPGDIDVQARAAKIHSYGMGQAMMARIQNSMEPLERDLKSGLFRIIGVEDKVLETA